MGKNRRSFMDFLRNNEQAHSMITSIYRPFSIANVIGNLAPMRGWTTRLKNPPTIGFDELGRTVITTVDESPVYIVAHGTDQDFKTLSKSAGFPITGFNAVRVNSKMNSEGDARAQLVLLEFDSKRRRIGELKTRGSSKVRGALLGETAHVLPTIRIAGAGKITIDWLRLDTTSETFTPSADRIEPLTGGAGQPEDSRLSAIKADLAALQDKAGRISAELDDLDIPPAIVASALPQSRSSRDDGDISGSREQLSRELLTGMAGSLPDSPGSHHFGKIPASIAIITDEYMFNFYKDVFREVHYLSPDNHEQVLAENDLDAVIYVTCWKGMEGEDWKGVKFREKPAQALENILAYAKRRRIPTIFQTIEDPSNFEYFLPIAEKFEYIFTSDIDMVDRYRAELGTDKVAYGEYGANPLVNNPIGSFRFNFNRAFFAGSYPERYPERCADMRMIFDSIPERNEHLLILDRNFNSTGYDFPEDYQASIIGPVPHAVLQKMHKLFRYSLNFNSIKLSPTMCAMRVYELQAQGKPLISNYARSVFNRFPGIRLVANETTLTEFVHDGHNFDELNSANELMTDLLADKSSFAVVSRMAEVTGLPIAPSRSNEILVVAIGDIDAVEQRVMRQIHVNTTVLGEDDLSHARIDLSQFGYITAMSADRNYDPRYLASRLNAFVYTDSRFVTQIAEFSGDTFIDGPIHEFTSKATDRTTTLISTDHPQALDFATGTVKEINGAGYAADPFGIGYREYDAAQSNQFLAAKPRLSVIVPIYNNGHFLKTKCLPSLRRNNCWSEMEVLLIDDGSTDADTAMICQDLADRFDNVTYFSFGDGGSGSASRPRNRGVEMASADLITYLDPDNEISSSGYDVLLKEFDRLNASGTPSDLVSGYQVKVADTVKFTGRHAAGSTRIVADPIAEFFKAGRFPVVSTQAAVIRKKMLLDNGVRFIERAAGQDTLYGWQVLLNAKNPAFVDTAHLIYFAQRDDSVTNQVDVKYFDKSLTLEREQVKILSGLGILDIYLDKQFDNFMQNWYLDRLNYVGPEHKAEAMERLGEIAQLYGRNLGDYTSN